MSQTAPAMDRKKEVRRVLLSSYLGSTVEFYDFLLYGTAASLVFNKIFFHDLDPLVGTIASFGTLAAGYVARPLGGAIFGHFGDKLGRKSMLVITMTIMGVASTLVGLLPTSEQIGALAPLLLVLLRVLQGIAVGGEWGGAALMALEHADSGHRGAASSVSNMGGPSGAVLATLVFMGFSTLPEEQFLSWGWRVPFLLSAALVAIGLFVRLKVSESPLFQAAQEAAEEQEKAQKATRPPLVAVFAEQRRAVVLACGGGLGAFTVQSLLATFALSFAKEGGLDTTTVLLMHMFGSVLHIFTIPAFAALSDRVGRRPVMIGGAIAAAIGIYPVLLLLGSGNVWLVLAGFIIGNPILQASMYGPLAAFVSEMFGTENRYTGASLGYQLATTLGAGFAPVIGASLLSAAGGEDPVLVGAFAALLCLTTALAVWRAAESHRSDIGGAPEAATGSAAGSAAAVPGAPAAGLDVPDEVPAEVVVVAAQETAASH